jgi:hypothetical protein
LSTLTVYAGAPARLFEPAPQNPAKEWEGIKVPEQRQAKKKQVLRREAARRAFHRALARVEELRFNWFNVNFLIAILDSPVITPTLQRLSLSGSTPLFVSSRSTLTEALQRFPLSSLVIACPPTKTPDPRWGLCLRLSSLTFLEIASDGLGTDTVALISRIAPKLEHLSLISHKSSLPPSSPTGIVVPHLRSLHISGHFVAALVAFFSSSPVFTISLDLRHRSVNDLDSALSEIFSPSFEHLPPFLQSLRVLTKSIRRPYSEDSIRLKLAERGVSLHVEWIPSEPIVFRGPDRAKDDCRRVRKALKDDLKWANDTTDWLEKNDDVAGMKELSEVLQRLREKRVIAEQ